MLSSTNTALKNQEELPPLHMLGLLSARLAHSLSNQLSIVMGNLCAAAAAQNDPQNASAALQAAVAGANGAGLLLGRFVEMRRSINTEGSLTSAKRLCDTVRNWASSHAWTVESESNPISDRLLGAMLSPQEIAFVLSAIRSEAMAQQGRIIFGSAHGSARSNHSNNRSAPEAFLLMRLEAHTPLDLDWVGVRATLNNFRLAAASEIISLSAATVESFRCDSLLVTELSFPLFNYSL